MADTDPPKGAEKKVKKRSVTILWRLVPLLVLIIAMVLAYSFGLDTYFTYENLKANRQILLNLVGAHPVLAPVFYIIIYAISTSLSIPGATFLTIAGGFLFPQPFSTLYTVIGATIGATIIFLIAKTALGAFLREKAAPFLKKMEAGFNRNAASYLLFLRFIPLFPFWLVNIAPAVFNVSTITYIWTTFLGIIPGSFVYTQAGAGLGAIFDSGEEFSLDTIFNMQVRIALICLAIFALIPIVVKKILQRKKKS